MTLLRQPAEHTHGGTYQESAYATPHEGSCCSKTGAPVGTQLPGFRHLGPAPGTQIQTNREPLTHQTAPLPSILWVCRHPVKTLDVCPAHCCAQPLPRPFPCCIPVPSYLEDLGASPLSRVEHHKHVLLLLLTSGWILHTADRGLTQKHVAACGPANTDMQFVHPHLKSCHVAVTQLL